MAEWIGRTVGNYRVEELLGAGGMGQVYRARHIHLERQIALKVLHTDFAQNANFVQRFRQEARAVAALRHPNIVEVYDFGEQDSVCYLAMELVTGGALRGLLRRRTESDNAEWSLPLGLTLVREAARALDFAHQHGIVHRDVKPDNILLLPQTNSPLAYSARLSDFGLARLAENSGLTATGVAMGTPAYISPEQCRGEEVDGRTDLYSLGIVLYEVATGLLPFAVKTLSDAVYKHVHTTPPPPRSVAPTMSPELEAVILRCIAKSPEDRFATGAELDAALGRVPEMQPTVNPHHTADTVSPSLPGVKTAAATTGPVASGNAPMPVSVLGSSLLPRVQTLDAQGQMLGVREIGGDGLTLGRLPTNNIVLDGAEVSRHHLRLDWDGTAVIITDLGSSNGSFLSGRRLAPQTPTHWSVQDALQVGTFFLRLIPAATANAGAGVGTVLPGNASGNGVIGVVLAEESLSLMPGKSEALRITVANLSNKVEHLEVEVTGVPESWVKKPSRPTQLNPGAQATIPLGIEAPRTPQSKVGEYPVTVRVRSRETPERFGEATGSWKVLPFDGAAVTMTPLKNGGTTQAKYTLNLRNEGNSDSRWNLKAIDDEQALTYDFDQPQLNLGPGETGAVHLTVQAARRWLGTPQTQLFTVQINASNDTAASGGATPQTLTQPGQFVHRAILPPWVPPAALALLAATPFVWKSLVAKPDSDLTTKGNNVVLTTSSPAPLPSGTLVVNATNASLATGQGGEIKESPKPTGEPSMAAPTPDPTPSPTPAPTPTPRPDKSADTADIQRVAIGRLAAIRLRLQKAREVLAQVKDVPLPASARGSYRWIRRPPELSEAEKTTLATKALIRFPERNLGSIILQDPKRFPRPHFSPRVIASPVVVATPVPTDTTPQQAATKSISDLHLWLTQVWGAIIAMGVGQAPQDMNFAVDDPPTMRASTENRQDFGVPKFSCISFKGLYSRMLANRYTPTAERRELEQEFEALVSRYEHPDQYPLAPLYPHILIYGSNALSIGTPEYKTDMQQIDDWLNQVEQDVNEIEARFQ